MPVSGAEPHAAKTTTLASIATRRPLAAGKGDLTSLPLPRDPISLRRHESTRAPGFLPAAQQIRAELVTQRIVGIPRSPVMPIEGSGRPYALASRQSSAKRPHGRLIVRGRCALRLGQPRGQDPHELRRRLRADLGSGVRQVVFHGRARQAEPVGGRLLRPRLQDRGDDHELALGRASRSPFPHASRLAAATHSSRPSIGIS